MNEPIEISVIDQSFCQLHPTVIIEILDHFRRRKSKSSVYGLLIGKRNRTSIEITETINMIVCSNRTKELNFDDKHLGKMIQFHKNTPQDYKILGIYGTVENPNYQLSKLFLKISEKMKDIYTNSIFLTMSCGKNENINRIRAFLHETKYDIMCFIKVPINLKYTKDEKLALLTITKNIERKESNKKYERGSIKPKENFLLEELYKTQRSLFEITNFINRQPYQNTKDWNLTSLIYEIPGIVGHKAKIQQILERGIQDLLLFNFLAKLTKILVNLTRQIYCKNFK